MVLLEVGGHFRGGISLEEVSHYWSAFRFHSLHVTHLHSLLLKYGGNMTSQPFVSFTVSSLP